MLVALRPWVFSLAESLRTAAATPAHDPRRRTRR
jgi:hypothetical protein